LIKLYYLIAQHQQERDDADSELESNAEQFIILFDERMQQALNDFPIAENRGHPLTTCPAHEYGTRNPECY
jgi:hypothetical protein